MRSHRTAGHLRERHGQGARGEENQLIAYARNCPFFNTFAGGGGFFRRAQTQKIRMRRRFDSSRRAKDNIAMFTLMTNSCRTAQQMVKNKKSLTGAGVEVR